MRQTNSYSVLIATITRLPMMEVVGGRGSKSLLKGVVDRRGQSRAFTREINYGGGKTK